MVPVRKSSMIICCFHQQIINIGKDTSGNLKTFLFSRIIFFLKQKLFYNIYENIVIELLIFVCYLT